MGSGNKIGRQIWLLPLFWVNTWTDLVNTAKPYRRHLITNNSTNSSFYKMYTNCVHTVQIFPVCFSIDHIRSLGTTQWVSSFANRKATDDLPTPEQSRNVAPLLEIWTGPVQSPHKVVTEASCGLCLGLSWHSESQSEHFKHDSTACWKISSPNKNTIF